MRRLTEQEDDRQPSPKPLAITAAAIAGSLIFRSWSTPLATQADSSLICGVPSALSASPYPSVHEHMLAAR